MITSHTSTVVDASIAKVIRSMDKNSTVVDTSIANFIRTMERNARENAAALEALNERSVAATAAHMKSIGDMQAKLQGSFDRMRYLEKKFHDVPGLIPTHLETQLPAILTDVVGTALAPTLATVLNECLPRTVTDALKGPLTDFRSQLRADGGGASTLRMQELADAHNTGHTEVMTAIKDLGARITALDCVFCGDSPGSKPHPYASACGLPRARLWSHARPG
jgi:hypothetical protein